MYSWSVNTSITYYHTFSTVGSHFVSIYTIITQLPPPQVNSITLTAVNACHKVKTTFGDVILNNLTNILVQTLLTKNALISFEKYLSLNINGKTVIIIKFLFLLLLLLYRNTPKVYTTDAH